MQAVVDIAGKQFKVETDKYYYVPLMAEEVGKKVTLDQVLMIVDDKKTVIGTPVIEKARVEATVLAHVKGDKVKIFKMKRRKGFRRQAGHRQQFTKLGINSIQG